MAGACCLCHDMTVNYPARSPRAATAAAAAGHACPGSLSRLAGGVVAPHAAAITDCSSHSLTFATHRGKLLACRLVGWQEGDSGSRGRPGLARERGVNSATGGGCCALQLKPAGGGGAALRAAVALVLPEGERCALASCRSSRWWPRRHTMLELIRCAGQVPCYHTALQVLHHGTARVSYFTWPGLQLSTRWHVVTGLGRLMRGWNVL